MKIRAEDEGYMGVAIEAAMRGVDAGQTPFGACVVRDGKVLAEGHNRVWADTDITAHAEIVVIREACEAAGDINLDGATIYSTVEPCPMCFSAIHWARITRVVYGASIQDAARYGFHEIDLSNREMRASAGLKTEIVDGLLKERAIECFERWIQKKASKAY